LTGIASLLLAVSTWGGEYSDRTLRTTLIRYPSRWGLLLGKMAALAAGIAVIIVLATLVETLVASLSHWVQLGGRDLGTHLLVMARIGLPLAAIWWLTGLVYAGLVILITVGLRSPALGMAAGLVLFLFDFIMGSLGPSGPDAWYVRYLVTNNSYGLIAPLMAGRFDVTAGGMFAQLASLNLPAAADALATLLCFVGGTLGLAYLLLAYRDIK
jgi:ABC-type transport system involved in multi-copper enzyme maturation permease subunit